MEIDAEVSARVAAGESIYTLDDARIRAIDPDLILAQDLCQVCAVPSGAVEEALDVIGCHAQVVSLDPGRLDEVIGCIGTVGAATGTSASADALMEGLRARVDAVRQRVRGRQRPRVLVLEWQDPPFNAGHWVPDQVEAAGGMPVLAAAGARSRRLTWEEIGAADVDITIFMPCGFDLEGAVAQAPALLARPEAAGLGRDRRRRRQRVLLPSWSTGRRRGGAPRGPAPRCARPPTFPEHGSCAHDRVLPDFRAHPSDPRRRDRYSRDRMSDTVDSRRWFVRA